MPFYKCPECQLERETLAPSGVCFVCTEKTEATRLIDADVPTLTRQLPDTVTQGSTTDDWAGALPPGGYKYDDIPLGEGGMGVVWRVVRESTGEVFAVKKLKPESFTPTGIRRFVAEARSLVAVQNDHVVRLFDFVPDQNDPYLLLEYVPGESLGSHIRSVGPLHPRRAARMIAEAAKGVDAAHRVGVIHRDLKPGNLLLTLDGRVKVADFGLCKTLVEEEVPVPVGATTGGGEGNTPVASGTLTATGRLAGGTPGFMAPEQVSEDFGPVGCAADVWGLGACLHAALTAQSPFPGGKANMALVLTAAHTPPHELAVGVPDELSAIVAKCLTKDPKRRYESAAAVAADLESYLSGDGTSLHPHSWPRRQWRKVRKTPAGVKFAVAIAVLAVAVGISLAMVPKPKEQPAVLPVVETADEIQERYRQDLRAGKTVTLIGEKGLPRHHRWRMGSPTLVESWADDSGACAFESVGHTLLELLDDPGVDHYILRAELQQLRGKQVGRKLDPARLIGLYVGHARTPDVRGGVVHSLFWIAFSDSDPNFPRRQPITNQFVRAEWVLFHGFAADPTQPNPVDLAKWSYTPSPALPGAWRAVEFEVSPTAITPRWVDAATGAIPFESDRVLDPQELSKQHPEARQPLPLWSPRMPVGIHCGFGAVAVKNATITPIFP